MMLLLVFLLLAGILLLMVGHPGYSTHHFMMDDEKLPWAYGEYQDFVKCFNLYRHELEPSDIFKGSWFSPLAENEFFTRKHCIHASIFRFNGVGMRINGPFQYFRVCLFLWREKSNLPSKRIMDHKW